MAHIPHKGFDPIERFPSSRVNNARKIVLEKVKKFYEQPSGFRAKEMEEFGYEPDISPDGSDQGVELDDPEFYPE